MKDNSVFALYINTKVQIADMFTQGNFVIPQWRALCDMAQVRQTPTKVSQRKPLPVEELQPPTPKKKSNPKKKKKSTPEKTTREKTKNVSPKKEFKNF